MTESPRTVTRLLLDWRGGDSAALDRLTSLLYEDLHALAARSMRGERSDHTLQPTALVGEAYARLVEADVSWQDRAHFFAVAARTMRRVLVDHARHRNRVRRGGGDWQRVTLTDALGLGREDGTLDFLDLHQALEELAEYDARKAQAVELRYFAGLGPPDVARVLEVSESTVHRELRFATAWLRTRLAERP
ncbi:MAG: ECF-type sigma factor [bacterium]